jgi:prepilin-type N-terminal cleavage/methylation domain-containing protein
MKNIHKKINGFTLAEILITLLIIGVVASLVIPALINDTQEAELKIAFKKAYSDINQATMLLINDNAGSLKGLCANNDCQKNLFLPYLSYTKSCSSSQGNGNCWHEADKFWFLDGTPTSPVGWSSSAGIVLSSGVLLKFWDASSNCSVLSMNACGTIAIDVNGFKGPNRFGKDILRIYILEKGIKPFGTQGDLAVNLCEGSTGSNSGYGCAAKYLYQ